MTFDEDGIRQSLRRNLDDLEVPRDVPTATLRRGRARRLTWMAGVASIVVIALLGGIAGGMALTRAERETDIAPGPATERRSVRYFFEVDQGDASASGTLEVEVDRPSLCLTVQTRDIMASHLLFDDPSVPGIRPWSIAFTFFEPDRGEGGATLPASGTHCVEDAQLESLGDDGLLADLVDEPERFRVDFHRGPNDEPGLLAELMTFEEAFAGATYVDEEDRVSVHVPSGWHVAPRSLTPKLIDPKEILSMGTAPLPSGGDRCAQQPENALESMSEVDAFVSVQEAAADANHPPRPVSFQAAAQGSSDQFESCVALEDIETYWIPFSDEGRNFYLLAAVGTSSGLRKDEMWKVIESLDFSPTQPNQEENDFEGSLGTVETQGGTVRLEVSPESPELGLVPRVVLSNDTQGQIGYGHDYLLERRTESGWQDVKSMKPRRGLACAFASELILLKAGQKRSHVIGPLDRHCGVLPLPAGIYRVTKQVELESGERVPLTAGFEVGDPPAACETHVAGECGELQWTADVAAAAGFDFSFQDGGGAPEIKQSHVTFKFWALIQEKGGDRRALLTAEDYEKVGQVGEISLYSDGQRLTWEVHGLYAWLSGVDGIDASTPGVKDVVEASVRVPYPTS